MAEATVWAGRRLRRLEDPKLLQGRGAYVDDLAPEGTLHVAFVRSPHAHARVVRVDPTSAERAEGVVAVVTADHLPPARVPAEGLRGAKLALHPVLADGVVRYVGQPVAAVVATSRARAEDAAGLVEVRYEPLEAVVDPFHALEGRTLVHPELGTNVAYRRQVRAGDPDAAFARAHRVVRATIRQQRVAAVPLEPRGVLAWWDGSRGLLTVWSSTQVPHDLRDALAEVLRMPANRVRVVAPDVGGGFGAKLNTYPEEVLVAHLSRELRRPVKWVASRREDLLSTAQGRSQVGTFEVACDAKGTLLAIRARLVADVGAYTLATTVDVPALTVRVLTGPYAVEHVQAEVVEVYTHKTPTGAYRGAGRPEATFYLERLVDLVAAELGLDPAAVRRRNLLPKAAFPYRTPTGARYDSGDYRRALRVLLRQAGYRELRRQQRELRRRGRYLGIGLSCYVEVCTFGWETARVRVAADGSVTVFTGTSPHGQGGATGIAQLVADRLGVRLDQVEVVHGDTLAVPSGMGTAGSRTLVVGGSAAARAADRVRRKMVRLAAHLLEAASGDVQLQDGKFTVRGAPDRAVTVAEVASAAYQAGRLPEGMQPGLEEEGSFVVQQPTAPFGAHLCVVEVDPETGQVQVLRYVSVDDCGVVVNPLLVEGQIQGGIVQAMGQAFLEEAVFDPTGQPLTASLADYALPRAVHAPAVEMHRTVTPSPTNPLGAKGVGEAGTIGATPAFVNAVVDALRPFGVRHLDTPLHPERVWRAVREAGAHRR